MTGPKVLVRDPDGKQALEPAPEFGWQLWGVVGLAFAAVGGMDQLLTWFPFSFGSAEWEFGTVTASFDGLPLLAIGLTLLLGAGVARGQRWLVRFSAIVLFLLGITIVGAAIIYVTDVPIALKSISDPVVRLGLKKAIAKTAGQAVIYPCVFFWLAVKGWSHAKAR